MLQSGETTIAVLARHVSGFDPVRLDASTRDAVRRALLDLMGCAIAGFDAPAARAARAAAAKQYAPGGAGVWFSGSALCAAGAAFANASAASALDLDDGHRRAGGHPGASVIPAALAVAQQQDSDEATVLAAIALGYDVAVRIAAARDFSRLDTLSTGRWCGYGAAAAAAFLMRLDEDATAHAMAIAGVVAPGLSASGYSRFMGNSVKEGIAFATAQGVIAAELAAEGYTGPLDILDHADYYDAAAIRAAIGAPRAVEDVHFKPYACCRWIHAAIDAALDLRRESAFDPGGVWEARVDTFGRALRLSNETAPQTLEGAQYSLPFVLACALVEGAPALLPMCEALLRRGDLVAAARRVTLAVDPGLDALFPARAGARVTIRAGGRTHVREVTTPIGDPANPMSTDALLDKFGRLAVRSPRAQAIGRALLRFGEGAGASALGLEAPLAH